MIRLRAGEWLAAAGAVALPVSLALPWYRPRARQDELSGFESFAVVDLLLVLLAALGLALAVLHATRRTPAAPVGAAVLAVTAGIPGVLAVLWRVLDQPGPDEFLAVRTGAWLGLAAALAVAAGGWLSLANEHVRGLPPAPEPELRPAPAP